MSDVVRESDHWRQRLPIVGREQEQALLRTALEAALAGHGGLVLLDGEAGIGKTTLVDVLGQEAARRGALALIGHCQDLVATPPYGPWRALLAAAPAVNGRAAPPLDEVGVPGAARNRSELFARVIEFVAALAAQRPLLLVLEDLHWSDQASLDLLHVFARPLRDLPLLLVATYRDDELTRRHELFRYLPALVRESGAQRLHLRRLDADATDALVGARYRLPELDRARLVAYVQRFAEGNPLFAGELLRALEVSGVLRRVADDWALGEIPTLRVPPLVLQVIEARLARLSGGVRELLEAAAVIGQAAPLDVLLEVAGAGEDDLIRGLDEAFDAHVLVETAAGALQFSHALVREALYAEAPPQRRRAWHRRTAEALAAAPRAQPDAVAHHFVQAGDGRAADWLTEAGLRAERAYAFVMAAERYTSALALLGEAPALARRRGWLAYRAGRLLSFYDLEHGLASLEQARRLAADAGDRVLAAYAQAAHGLHLGSTGAAQRELAELEAGIAAFDALTPADLAPPESRGPGGAIIPERLPDVNPFTGELIRRLGGWGRLTDALARGEPFVAQLAPQRQLWLLEPGAQAAFSAACYGLASAYAALGRPADARRLARQAGDAAEAAGDYIWLNGSLALDLWIVLWFETDRVVERQRLKDAAAAAHRRSAGALSDDAATSQTDHWAQLLDGNWDAMEAQALAGWSGHTHAPWRQDAANALASLARNRGEPVRALELIREALPVGPAAMLGEHPYFHTLRTLRIGAALALDAHDLPAAREWLETHERWLTGSGASLGRADATLLWARWHWLADERTEARQIAERALADAGSPRQPLALLTGQRLLGEFALADRQLDDAQQQLTAALVLADACAAPFERALTQLALAELRALQRHPDEARALLDAARAVCAALGAAPALARCAELAARLSGRGVAASYPAGLSGREVEVLRLVAQGLSNAAVAERLFVSRRTVSTHLTSVYTKLGVATRAAATRFAVEHNLV